MQLTQYLGEKETAKSLNKCPATLKRWRRQRKGPPYLVVNGRPLYDPVEVTAWLEGQRPEHSKPQALTRSTFAGRARATA